MPQMVVSPTARGAGKHQNAVGVGSLDERKRVATVQIKLPLNHMRVPVSQRIDVPAP